MDIKKIVTHLDLLVTKGNMIEGIHQFFADHVITSDYRGVQTENKKQALEKMQAIKDAIFKVNTITHHNTIVDGYESASEFTFDFILRGNSTLYWHEIIRRRWNPDGKVIREEYFNSHNIKINHLNL